MPAPSTRSPTFPVSQDWADRARRTDAWGATRAAIMEVDDANLGYPHYVDHAVGARLWDVDGNEYLDFILGYGPVVLGHADPRVLAAVTEQLMAGACASPLWHPRQVELTELLCRVIPGAEQAYLLRTGSDATTAAVRLCRIHTGRDKVVRWGYNGWHDWCAPRTEGVPAATLADTLGFGFNDPDSLERVLVENRGEVACVVMMTYELELPAPGFLQQVRDLAHRHGALFVLDEMRSGFRLALGGAQEYFDVRADLATYSKAMANGFPISAVVGRADVLAGLGRTHMSSTYYGNAAEMAAAIATIEILRDTDALERIHRLGEAFVSGLSALVDAHRAPARVVDIPVSPFLVFDGGAQDAKVRFFTEAIRGGVFLHPNHQWFLSAAHTDDDVRTALEVCDRALAAAT